jgi:hypothetical protein
MNGYLSPHSNQPLSSSPNVFRNGFQVESLSLSLFSLNSFIFFTCPPIICIPTCSCWVSLDYSLAITMIRLNIIRYFCDEPQRCYWNLTAERDMQHGWLVLIWFGNLDARRKWELTSSLIFSLFLFISFFLEDFSVWPDAVAMRLFKRRVSDPAPQLVSLAAINSEMDQAGGSRVTANNRRYSNSSDDYADYQTVTAMPAMVVVDDAPRKRKSISIHVYLFYLSHLLLFKRTQRVLCCP